mmetsp:Transcript_22332/g.88116  ORF Transcript_22332/g.88116 Transcript_22332/m.88116 type:complete len:290 (-) Transcript_22332:3073-3942(-)
MSAAIGDQEVAARSDAAFRPSVSVRGVASAATFVAAATFSRTRRSSSKRNAPRSRTVTALSKRRTSVGVTSGWFKADAACALRMANSAYALRCGRVISFVSYVNFDNLSGRAVQWRISAHGYAVAPGHCNGGPSALPCEPEAWNAAEGHLSHSCRGWRPGWRCRCDQRGLGSSRGDGGAWRACRGCIGWRRDQAWATSHGAPRDSRHGHDDGRHRGQLLARQGPSTHVGQREPRLCANGSSTPAAFYFFLSTPFNASLASSRVAPASAATWRPDWRSSDFLVETVPSAD